MIKTGWGWLGAILFLALFVKIGFAETPQAVYSEKHDRKFYLGLKPHAKSRALPDVSFLRADVKVPNDFVMTDKWPLPCGIFDQGNCGSCVYNSIVQNYQYSLSIRGILPAGTCPLSREHLMNCIPNGGQCDGDWAENVGGGLVGLKGLYTEKVYPYTTSSGRCKAVNGDKIGPIVGGHVIDNSPKSMASAMVMGVPVSITVGADNAWSNVGTDVYRTCTQAGTNHEVLLVGIHCTGSAKGADGFCDFSSAKATEIIYDVVNSWGSRWGDNGVIHTQATDSRGRLCNNVAEEAYVLDTGVPLTPPVDGGWSAYGACVNGVQTRTCTNPVPSSGGKPCVGPSEQVCQTPSPALGIPLWVWFVLGGLVVIIVLLGVNLVKKKIEKAAILK